MSQAPSSRANRWVPPGTYALAPMEGVTDAAYRKLWTSRAPKAVSFCVTEFVRVSDRTVPDELIRRACPEVAHGGTTRGDVPVLLQLLGGAPEPLAATAQSAIRLGAYGIDLNFGCPARLVNRHDGGAALLRAPERIERIVAAVRSAVPSDRPVSVKIRLGFASHDEVVPIALAAERGGASWLTIHGRTKLEMYGPPADWSAIGSARAALSIAVIANGDLNTRQSVEHCGELSGCKHFMFGRGPMANPSLLLDDSSQAAVPVLRLLGGLLLEYLELSEAAGNSEERQVARVKQWLTLAIRVNPALAPYFDSFKRTRARAELCRQLVA